MGRRENKEKREMQDKVKSRRLDGDLDHVIINEEAVKNQLKDIRPRNVPFPFRTAEEYANSLRMPIGKEFVPHDASMKATKQEVKVKAGQVITPLERGDEFQKSEDNLDKSKKNKKKKSNNAPKGDISKADVINL